MRDTDWSHVVKFLTPIKRSERIHPNFVFRFSFCGLGDEQAARSAGVSIEQIHKWDDGEELPFLVRKVWLFESGRELPKFSGFEGWTLKGGRIVTPAGVSYTERQLRVALYHLDEYGRPKY